MLLTIKPTKLIQLSHDLKDKNQDLKLSKIIEYFIKAKFAYEISEEYLKRWVQNREKEADEKFQISVLSIYSNARICLDITHTINNEIEQSGKNQCFKNLREKYKDWAKRFIGFRNDLTSHVINEKDGYFSEIVMYGNVGPRMTVNLYDISTMEIRYKYEIQPKQDLEKLSEYLDKLAIIYKKSWAKI